MSKTRNLVSAPQEGNLLKGYTDSDIIKLANYIKSQENRIQNMEVTDGLAYKKSTFQRTRLKTDNTYKITYI